VAVVLTGCIGCGDPSGGISNSSTGVGASLGGSSSKAFRILQEQKNKAENVTRRAVELIKSERMLEVRQLYKSRWSDLADLRTNIAFDNELTSGDKTNIDKVLRAEQESITEILAKYERLYGPGK
jgi:hypothetical protein